ncbi:MAG: HD domain-containing protein, partial [Prevotella sp.]|nr:HD domain-containing protein [Prevotella sp.]
HPISVALIAAKELMLDTNSVTASFLHDIVEDTPYTIEDIRERFGSDVAFLVDAVTKRKKSTYRFSKQVDNYHQLLSSMQFDIRALMVKIADRLHNMRTLSSMRPDKQMKIAGETDYFYAPLANRLGLFDVKTDLENLSFKYRCGMEYTDIALRLEKDKKDNRERLQVFTDNVEAIMHKAGIMGKATVYWRAPYSIWRRMKAAKKDFIHLDNRYYVRVTFSGCKDKKLSEKDICLYIYSLLTNNYNEKPGSFQNLIDQGKENSYKSINVMLLSEEGIWEDVQICSDKMVEASRFGCMAEVAERAETRNCGNNVSLQNVRKWIEKFRKILKEIAAESQTQGFIENIKSSLYYDDVLAFTPKGEPIIMPKGATALDFAFELHTDIGLHAKYARINGKLATVRTVLNRGDVVEIGTDPEFLPKAEWMQCVQSYKARRSLRSYFSEELAKQQYQRCPCCLPLPGGEKI